MIFAMSTIQGKTPNGWGVFCFHGLGCFGDELVNTAGRDRSRCHWHGNGGTRQLALDCECDWVKLTHDVYEYTWKCGELTLYFSPSAGG